MSAETKKVTFVTSIARGDQNLRIILEHGKAIYESGVRVGVKKPIFANFKNGRFTTDNPEYIEKLRGLSSYGSAFYESTDDITEDAPEETKKATSEDLSSKTKPQLVEIAKQRGKEVKEGMTKPQLLELLK